ncbi:hypothetical protein [Chryseobacterium paridis]|uniref:Lipoprotein n=1 Tax=Chryseobacterium paridis TaxID=2800328 RepID=A0ABS1FWG2_9FLAO|nr:hypothetical protein [Chryseobacterium paridis]MBK1896781.1 hypothetical protein [Chryseobacterium paridis]
MKKILYTLSFIIALSACKENRNENTPIVDNVVDNAESSVSGSFKSSRHDDKIDQIYSELIKSNKNLQAIDDKVKIANDESNKVIFEYKEIFDKSESYYMNAKYHANAIGDSLMKIETLDMIKSSSDQYDLKMKNVTDLIAKVNANQEKMNDLYTIFKIKKTLPEIEKYQKAHPLKPDHLNGFINKQNQLLNEVKNLK